MFLSACHAHHPLSRFDTNNLDQHEITAAGPLLDANGELSEAGWSRRPWPQFNASQVQGDPDQLRQWDYYAVVSSELLIEITVANIRFAGFCSVLINDIRNPDEPKQIMASRGKLRIGKVIGSLPQNQLDRVSCVGGDGQEILSISKEGTERVFDINMPKALASTAVTGRIVLQEDPDHDSYVGVFPFRELEKGFFYENKVPGLPVTGHVVAKGQRYEIPATAYAVRDWGRGTWPKKLVWQWGMAGAEIDGHRLDVNLGAGFGDVTRGTENMFFVDGVGHKLGIVNWEFDRDDLNKPWKLTAPDGRFEATLTPTFLQPLRANVIFKGVKIHKVYGNFTGHVVLDDGSKLPFENLFGFTEEVYIRW